MFLGLGEIEVVFLCLALYDTQPVLGYILPFSFIFLKIQVENRCFMQCLS